MKHKNNGLVPDDLFMTRRDQMAALAMQGLLAGGLPMSPTAIASQSAEYADALIERLDAYDKE